MPRMYQRLRSASGFRAAVAAAAGVATYSSSVTARASATMKDSGLLFLVILPVSSVMAM